MGEIFPYSYEYAIIEEPPQIWDGSENYLRWGMPDSRHVIHRSNLKLSPVRDLIGVLLHLDRKFFYQVLIRPFDEENIGVVPRLNYYGPATFPMANSLGVANFEYYLYPGSQGESRSQIRTRFRNNNPALPAVMEDEDRYIRLNVRDLGLVMDFSGSAPEINQNLGVFTSDTDTLDNLAPSEENNFIEIKPQQFEAPPALESISEKLYEAQDRFGPVEAYYTHFPNDSPGIYLRPQSGSIDQFCELLGPLCPETNAKTSLRFDAEEYNDWSFTRYYKPEQSVFREERLTPRLMNKIMRRFVDAEKPGIVQAIFDPHRDDEFGFVVTLRVGRPENAAKPIPGNDDPLADIGFKAVEEESAVPFIRGSDEFQGQLPEPGYERWYLNADRLPGLLLFRDFRNRTDSTTAEQSAIDLNRIGPINRSIPDIDYTEQIDLTNRVHDLPENVLYNQRDGTLICRECDSHYDVPTVAEGPKNMEAAFTCCSNTIDDANMDAFRQPPLAGVDPILADEWDLPLRLLEFIALVGKVQFKELDPIWEYDYRESMTTIRDFLELSKSDIEPLIVPEDETASEGAYPLRRRRFKKKYYSLTDFGRKLLNRTRTYGETVGAGIRDLNESSAHVIGVHITAKFAQLLPDIEYTETYVPLNELVDKNSLSPGALEMISGSRADVIGFGANEEPVLLLEYELDSDHPADSLADAAQMGIIANRFNGLVGYIAPTQSRAKDLATILRKDAMEAQNTTDKNPTERLGSPEELTESLDHPSSAPVPDLTQDLLKDETPLVMIETSSRIEDILDDESIAAGIEDGSIWSIPEVFDHVYTNEYARYSTGDFIPDELY